MRREEWTLEFKISGEIPKGPYRKDLTKYCLKQKEEYERRFDASCVVTTTVVSTPIKGRDKEVKNE